MLQRMQSVWLLLAGVFAFAGLKFPYYVGTTKDLIPSSELTGTHNVFTIGLSVAIGVLALVAIFLYKNRTLQMRLCILGMLAEAGLIALYYSITSTFSEGTYALTALLQGCIVLFFVLAARGISRDNKIIKESNRLR